MLTADILNGAMDPKAWEHWIRPQLLELLPRNTLMSISMMPSGLVICLNDKYEVIFSSEQIETELDLPIEFAQVNHLFAKICDEEEPVAA